MLLNVGKRLDRRIDALYSFGLFMFDAVVSELCKKGVHPLRPRTRVSIVVSRPSCSVEASVFCGVTSHMRQDYAIWVVLTSSSSFLTKTSYFTRIELIRMDSVMSCRVVLFELRNP